jgi:hypothetical protein
LSIAQAARSSVGGRGSHTLNRGNRRQTVVPKAPDYDAFLAAMADALARTPLDLLGDCLRPNRFHLVSPPHAEGDLVRWMPWLLMAHAA